MDLGKKPVLLDDSGRVPETPLPLDGEYETLLALSDPHFAFPELDGDIRATTFYTTGTTGLPKGVLFQLSPARLAPAHTAHEKAMVIDHVLTLMASYNWTCGAAETPKI